MTRMKTVFRCGDCGGESLRWSGRCPGCGAWNTVSEETVTARSGRAAGSPGPAVTLSSVPQEAGVAVSSGDAELDRVLDGGLVPGSVTLLAGEPGIGKSTLLLQTAAAMARRHRRCLIVSAEESPAQVRRRAARLGSSDEGLWLTGETMLPAVEAGIAETCADVVMVDSIQTVWDPEVDGAPGSVAQVRHCAQRLVTLAKATGTTTLLVGHVTKDGTIAGPRVLEHTVDTVLSFEGDRHHALRLLRAVKHRFGPTGELGVYEMTGEGLVGVDDPSGLFLGDRCPGTPGSVVFAAMEGQRPLLVEVQALAVPSTMASPRRSASGFDAGRLALLLAVLERRAGVRLGRHDVYVSVAGGVRVADPGADLAVCLALASALREYPVDPSVVAVGEVGLGGEVRQVAHTARRLAEAARLGFGAGVVPLSAPGDARIAVRAVATLSEAVEGCVGTRDVVSLDGGRRRVRRPGSGVVAGSVR